MLSSRLVFYGLLLILILTGGFFSHFWITDRLGVFRTLYPLQARWAEQFIRCSDNAPDWMHQQLKSTVRQISTRGQITYLHTGQLHHCEVGVHPETRLRYASMTKLLTAQAILDLVQAEQLHLDDRLLGLIPSLPAPKDDRWQQITVRHLLQHEAGFDRLRSTEQMTRHRVQPWCPYDLSRLMQVELDFAPGDEQQYSNTGYCLLGVLLEQMHDKPFRDVLTERFSLTHKNIIFVDGPYSADEVIYDFRNGDFYTDSYHRLFDFEALSSSAGLSGSARALVHTLDEITNDAKSQLLSGEPPIGCDESKMFECYGFSGSYYQEADHPLRLFIQGGLLPGVTSSAVLDSEGGVTVWISAGVSPPGVRGSTELNTRLYERLHEAYGL